MKRTFDIVVACDKNKGIGAKTSLPWDIPRDMRFFKDLTTTGAYKPDKDLLDVVPVGKSNAVIMGRVTWESIPDTFRPLKDRVNVILSRDDEYYAPGATVMGSLDEALDFLYRENHIHNIYVMGGASIYKEAFERQDLGSLYVTEIDGVYDCDVFIPKFEEINGCKKIWSSPTYTDGSSPINFSKYNFNNYVSFEDILEMEKRVALEIYEYAEFGVTQKDGYVSEKLGGKFTPCPRYLRNIYKALEVGRHVYAKYKKDIKITRLDLEPLRERDIPKGAPDEEKFKYTFKVEMMDGTSYSMSHTHACYAICTVCLKINNLFRREK